MLAQPILLVFGVGLGLPAGAAPSFDEAVAGLSEGSGRQRETELALRAAGPAARPLLESLERSKTPGVAVRARRVRRWTALELGDTAIRPEVIDRLVTQENVAPELVAHAAVFKPFSFRTFLLLDADRLNRPGGAENNLLAEAIRKAIRDNLAGIRDPSALRTDDLPSRTVGMLAEAMACDAAARKLLNDMPKEFSKQGGVLKPEPPELVELWAAYRKWRNEHPDLPEHLGDYGFGIELRWLERTGDTKTALGYYSAEAFRKHRDQIRHWLNGCHTEITYLEDGPNPALKIKDFSRREEVEKLDPCSLNAREAAGYFDFLQDPHLSYDHKNDPVTLYATYAKTRAKLPELGPALTGHTRVLESRWLAENGRTCEGFYLAQSLPCGITAGWIGAWLRDHPEARQERIPVKGDPKQPVFGPFIANFAPLTKQITRAEEDRIVAAFGDWADDLWLDLARRNGHLRLYFLCMARRDRLMDSVDSLLSRPGFGPGLRELGKVLASRPELGVKIVPEKVPPVAVCHVAGGMLDGGSTPEAVATFVRRWLPSQPGIFNHLTTDELRPVAELGSRGP